MIGVFWTGPNGIRWDLRSGPAILTDAGVDGLGLMEAEVYTQTSPLLSGQRRTGWKAKERDLSLPVLLQAKDEWSLLSRMREWNQSFVPGVLGRLEVTAPDGSTRWIDAELDMGGSTPLTVDPMHTLTYQQLVTLTSDDPWWRGDQITQSFQLDPWSMKWLAPPGADYVFQFGAGNTLQRAQIANPGDVHAWPVWTVWGPITYFRVGVDDHFVEATITLRAGDQVVVDTRPAVQALVLIPASGRRSLLPWAEFTALDFAPVPPGRNVPLAIEIHGTGGVSIELDPAYYRAFA